MQYDYDFNNEYENGHFNTYFCINFFHNIELRDVLKINSLYTSMEFNSVIQFWPLLNFNKKTNLMSNYIWLKTRMKYSTTVVNNLFKNSEMTRIWAFMRLVNLKLIQYMYLTIKRFENMAALKYAKELDQLN